MRIPRRANSSTRARREALPRRDPRPRRSSPLTRDDVREDDRAEDKRAHLRRDARLVAEPGRVRFQPFPDILPGDDAGDAAPATDFAVASAPRPRRGDHDRRGRVDPFPRPPARKGERPPPRGRGPAQSGGDAEALPRAQEDEDGRAREDHRGPSRGGAGSPRTTQRFRQRRVRLRAARPRDGPAARAESIVGAGETRGGSDDTDAAPAPAPRPLPDVRRRGSRLLGDRFEVTWPRRPCAVRTAATSSRIPYGRWRWKSATRCGAGARMTPPGRGAGPAAVHVVRRRRALVR